jgi:hypothetical protein
MRLNGEEAIMAYLGWDASRFQKHRSAMKEAGVLLYEYHGRPRKKCMWTLTVLLERWLVINAKEGRAF